MDINSIKREKYISSDAIDMAISSFYIALEAYFSTYVNIKYCILDWYELYDDVFDVKSFSKSVSEVDEYQKSYLNIVLHLQHFFELEVKRVLEDECKLFSKEVRSPVVFYKYMNGQLSDDELDKLKSLGFAALIDNLKELVNKECIDGTVANIFVNNNNKVLKEINYLRNSMAHSGEKVRRYCDLDDFFSKKVFPLLIDLIEDKNYMLYFSRLNLNRIWENINNIVELGKKSKVDYGSIALEKEKARCKLYVCDNYDRRGIGINSEFCGRSATHNFFVDEEFIEGLKCPCCGKEYMVKRHEFVGFSLDEIESDSERGGYQVMEIPKYVEYKTCVICTFVYTDFLSTMVRW